MAGQAWEHASVSRDETTDAAEAIVRSRAFLETRLLPDLEQTAACVSHLEHLRDCYLRLQEEMQAMERSVSRTAEAEPKSSALANLGQGVHLPVDVAGDALVIVSLGLRENAEDWKSDSGLYVQMTAKEADAFSEKKVKFLARRLTMAKEKLALIQGHAELTTQSIAQLEQLQAEPSSSLIDYLQT